MKSFVITKDKQPTLIINTESQVTQEMIERLIKTEYSDDFTFLEYSQRYGWKYRFNKSGREVFFDALNIPTKHW